MLHAFAIIASLLHCHMQIYRVRIAGICRDPQQLLWYLYRVCPVQYTPLLPLNSWITPWWMYYFLCGICRVLINFETQRVFFLKSPRTDTALASSESDMVDIFMILIALRYGEIFLFNLFLL
jgi:hypothetical protein